MKRSEQVAAFLKSQSTLSLATTDAGGAPCATPLFYFTGDGVRLYWLSSAFSRHSRNLKRSPNAAVSVYAPVEDWRQIRGVQMRGIVAIVTARAERRSIVESYCERFQLGSRFRAAIARSRLYCFQPEWIRYLDNVKRFGYKFELRVKAAPDRSGADFSPRGASAPPIPDSRD